MVSAPDATAQARRPLEDVVAAALTVNQMRQALVDLHLSVPQGRQADHHLPTRQRPLRKRLRLRTDYDDVGDFPPFRAAIERSEDDELVFDRRIDSIVRVYQVAVQVDPESGAGQPTLTVSPSCEHRPSHPVLHDPRCSRRWSGSRPRTPRGGTGARLTASSAPSPGRQRAHVQRHPQNFRHLRVIFTMQSARASFQNTGAVAYINNMSSNYSYAVRYAAAPSGSSNRPRSGVVSPVGIRQCPAGSRANDNYVSAGEVLLPFYSATDRIHTYQVKSGGDDGTNVMWVEGAWHAYYGDTNPITRIDIRDDVSGNLGPRAKAEPWAAP